MEVALGRFPFPGPMKVSTYLVAHSPGGLLGILSVI